MSDARPLAEAVELGGDPLLSLRTRVLRVTLAILALAVPGVAVLIVLASLRSGTFDDIVVGLSLYTLVFPLLWFLRRRLGFRISAVCVIAALTLTAFFVEARGGVAAGNVLLNALVLTLSAILFGRRGALVSLLAVVVLFVAAGLLVLGQVMPPVELSMWDPSRVSFWVRESAAFAMFATALVLIPVYVIDRLATEAKRLQRLAEAEREQLVALARAEREREQERERRLEALKALEQSRKIEALARLAGGIAHDFNNSLTVIMGAAAEIGAEAPPAENEGNARAIREAAERAAELTRGLLALGQGQVSNPRPVSLQTFLNRLGPALRRLLPGDITLDMTIPPAGVAVEVDPTDLERALLNLVINARDAMPRGGKLAIGCALRGDGVAEHQGRVALTVADTGVGMAPEMLDRIFEPFFTTKTPGIGTGLGLATVQAFVKESRGEVLVRSAPDTGTTFTLLLPACAEPAAPEKEPPAVPRERLAATSARRVLLVEDHEGVRTSMARTLARAGFEVTEAGDGDQAMALLARDSEFSLLCVDGIMPGVPTSVIIERAQQYPSMRILLCSGYLPEDLLRRGVRTGRYAYLQKPYSPDELLTAVQAALATSSPAPGA